MRSVARQHYIVFDCVERLSSSACARRSLLVFCSCTAAGRLEVKLDRLELDLLHCRSPRLTGPRDLMSVAPSAPSN